MDVIQGKVKLPSRDVQLADVAKQRVRALLLAAARLVMSEPLLEFSPTC